MLLKTHLAITILAVLVFISAVESKFIFILMAFIGTILPDIDSGFSTIGSYKILKPLQLFVRHRGLVHSFSFLFLITFTFVLFFPVLAFGFFLGYGLHLLADMFSVEGILPFYPLRKKEKGWIKTGSRTETSIFVFFIIADLLVFFLILKKFII